MQAAKEYAFLLLKFRMRSEKELVNRLKRKKFDEDVIKDALFFLKEKRFLDDVLFSKLWLQERLKKPYGLVRLRQELKLKGIPKEIIDTQVELLKDDYCEEEIVSRLAKDRSSKLKGVEPDKARQRIYGFLLRRGFSAQSVTEAVKRLKSNE